MKRHNRKSKPAKKAPATAAAQPIKKTMSRRDILVNSLIYTAGAAVIGGSGWYVLDIVAAEAKESDLSVVGNGVPVVVQIHDPSCPTCNALRSEAREAVCSFDESELQFRVANLQTKEGRDLADEYDVGKITLLMFDGSGTMRIALPGLKQAETLKPIFDRHVAQYSRKKRRS